MNYPRFGSRLVLSRLTGQKVPFQLNMHLTDVCNLRCAYCYVDFDHAAKDLPFATLKRIITEARACGTERISLEGGEPLARADIGDIVGVIRDLGMECNINTNGYFLPQRLSAVKRANMLSVSLDGPKDVHDRLRGAGSFDKAVAAITLAREHGLKVNVLSVLTRANRDAADYMLDLADTLDFHWVPTSLFFLAGKAETAEEAGQHKIEDSDYKNLLGELMEKKAAGRRIVWSRKTLAYVKDWPAAYAQSNMFEGDRATESFEPLKCQAARYFCVMQTNGDLYSCDPLLGYGKAANAAELGFREAFERTTTNQCLACNSLVCSEFHSLFAMDMPVIANLIATHAARH